MSAPRTLPLVSDEVTDRAIGALQDAVDTGSLSALCCVSTRAALDYLDRALCRDKSIAAFREAVTIDDDRVRWSTVHRSMAAIVQARKHQTGP